MFTDLDVYDEFFKFEVEMWDCIEPVIMLDLYSYFNT